jgi:hypothetical protein
VDEHTKRTLANEKQIYSSSGPPCGVTYLKMLMQKVEVNTHSTASHIWRLLTQLDMYMIKDAKNNITAFNDYVNDQMNTLATRGKTSSDIIINLIRGYMACTNKTFVEYIEKCKDNYEEGENIRYQFLMAKSERKYQAHTLNGEWNVPTQEQEETIALKARLAYWNQSKPKEEISWNMHEKNFKNFKQIQKPDQVRAKGNIKGTQAWRNSKLQAHESQTKVINGST